MHSLHGMDFDQAQWLIVESGNHEILVPLFLIKIDVIDFKLDVHPTRYFLNNYVGVEN